MTFIYNLEIFSQNLGIFSQNVLVCKQLWESISCQEWFRQENKLFSILFKINFEGYLAGCPVIQIYPNIWWLLQWTLNWMWYLWIFHKCACEKLTHWLQWEQNLLVVAKIKFYWTSFRVSREGANKTILNHHRFLFHVHFLKYEYILHGPRQQTVNECCVYPSLLHLPIQIIRNHITLHQLLARCLSRTNNGKKTSNIYIYYLTDFIFVYW